MKKLFFILFLFSSVTAMSQGNITIGTPGVFLSFNTAHHYDTIFINGGSYPGIQLINITGADSLHPTVIINKASQVVSNALTNDAAFELITCHYVKFTGSGVGGVHYGFLAGAGGTGSWDAHFGSSNIEVDSIMCDNAAGGYAGLIYRTYPSEGCQWSCTGTNAAPATKAQMDNPAWAIYGMYIHDNLIQNTGGEGMYLGQSHYGNVDANGFDPIAGNPLGGCSGGNESPIIRAVITRNTILNVGYDGIQASGCLGCSITQNTIIGFATGNTDGQDGGITWNPGSYGNVDRNWIQYTGPAGGFCMGIMYQGQGDSYITNNVVIGGGTGEVGLAFLRNSQANVLGSTHANIWIDNNTIVGFGNGYWWYGDNGFNSNTHLRNTIVQGTTIFSIGNGNIGTLQLTTDIQNTSTAFPQFTNYAGNVLTLQPTSPAVAKGTNITATDPTAAHDYTGATRPSPPSIGAYDFAVSGPTANAGANQVITLPANTVVVTSVGSTDGTGTITNWLWVKLSGPASGTIVTPTTQATSISGLTAGVYVFQVTVTDNNSLSSSASVQITVNQPPVANPGANQTLFRPTSSTTVNGSGSTDPDGSITGYLWSYVSGPGGSVITNPTSVSTTITALVAGIYFFKLTVTDNNGATASANIQISVFIGPAANAGPDQNIALPTTSVSLSGSASTDPDGTITTYAWTQTSGPGGATITTPANVNTTVTGLGVGTYVFKLTVTDNHGGTSNDTVQIQVFAGPPPPPVSYQYLLRKKPSILITIN